jgi:hypothetical protein
MRLVRRSNVANHVLDEDAVGLLQIDYDEIRLIPVERITR